jgi:hypothetical protein
MNYFITEAYLKNQTPITANVDVKDVTPYIRTQSDLRVQPILGTYFYKYLLAKYNAETLTTDEETLVEYIKPIVAWRSAEDAVFGLSYQLKNKGLQVQNGDYSNSVTQSEVAFAQDHYAQKASFYEVRLINYLRTYKDLYPQFTSLLNTDSDIKPLKTQENGFNDSILFI